MMERIRKMTLKELQALEKLIVEERETRIENELSGICAEAITNIDNLLNCCNKLGRHRLGAIEIECVDCECAIDVDILSDGILEDIRRMLLGYIKED